MSATYIPAVIKKSSFSNTNSAVTGPGFGGSDLISLPECISNINARVSSPGSRIIIKKKLLRITFGMK